MQIYRKWISCCILLSFTLLFHYLPAQNVLSLEKRKSFKRIYYLPGDFIRFQVHDDGAVYHGFIESVTQKDLVLVKSISLGNTDEDDLQVFRDYVPLENISVIFPSEDHYWQYFRKMFYAGTMAGGSALIGIATVNSIIEKQTPDLGSLIIVSSIMTLGLGVRYTGRNKYKLGKKWQLVVRPAFPVVPKENSRPE